MQSRSASASSRSQRPRCPCCNAESACRCTQCETCNQCQQHQCGCGWSLADWRSQQPAKCLGINCDKASTNYAIRAQQSKSNYKYIAQKKNQLGERKETSIGHGTQSVDSFPTRVHGATNSNTLQTQLRQEEGVWCERKKDYCSNEKQCRKATASKKRGVGRSKQAIGEPKTMQTMQGEL